MVGTFLLTSSASAIIMGIVLSGITATAQPIQGVMFCVPHGTPDYFYAFWVPMIVFESLLCGLALFRGLQSFLSEGPLFLSGRKLVSVLIRDSVLYFVVIFATYFTNLLVWVAAPVGLLEVPIGFSIAMSCVLANRMVLNVREMRNTLEASKPTSTQAQVPTHHISVHPPISPPYEVNHLTDVEMACLRSMKAEVEEVR